MIASDSGTERSTIRISPPPTINNILSIPSHPSLQQFFSFFKSLSLPLRYPQSHTSPSHSPFPRHQQTHRLLGPTQQTLSFFPSFFFVSSSPLIARSERRGCHHRLAWYAMVPLTATTTALAALANRALTALSCCLVMCFCFFPRIT